MCISVCVCGLRVCMFVRVCVLCLSCDTQCMYVSQMHSVFVCVYVCACVCVCANIYVYMCVYVCVSERIMCTSP